MKLLYCRNCHDIVRLSHRLKSCECGLCKGMYSDERHAQYTGEFAIPVGIANESFTDAIANQPKTSNEDGHSDVTFDAFVIPEDCATLERIG